MTVLEVIHRSTEFLAARGVESPRRNIEEMLARVLKLPRLNLYLNFDRSLKPAELEAVREMVRRRGRREPLQHILGSVSFCGLELAVNRHALVPRPETELLAERAGEFLSALPVAAPRALDFGTGSGCLAVALAVRAPTARVHAVDISPDALALARENAARHRVVERVEFHCGDGFAALPAGLQFELLVSNPPYVPTAEIETLQPEVREFDPRVALDGGADGLDYFRRLAREAGGWLRPEGRLMVELGDGQAVAVRELFSAQKWIVEAVVEDYSRRPRVLVARRN